MFILFRCSAGGNHGWGNIKRLELIYNALKNKYRFNYKFIVDANLEVKKYLTVKKINFESVTQINENNILNKIGPVDFSILELLHCSIKIQKKYKKISKKLIILDDITRGKYISDILISCQKKYSKVIKIKGCKFYNDYSYFPLTRNFDKYIKKKKKVNKEIKSIVIFVGGSNYIKTYIGLAKIFSKTNYKLTFLIGTENSHKISSEIKKISKKILIKINSNNIPKLIFDADLVVAGGGYTKVETAYLKTPLLTICIHSHQEKLVKDFYKTFKLDYRLKIKISEKKVIDAINFLNFQNRLKMSNSFAHKLKKNGVYKILKIIDD